MHACIIYIYGSFKLTSRFVKILFIGNKVYYSPDAVDNICYFPG